MTFSVAHRRGDAADLLDGDDEAAPLLRFSYLDSPTLVIGSAQEDDVVDRVACRDRGIDVVRRRSGGGAVLLEPGRHVWLDVLIESDGERRRSGIEGAFVWVGQMFADAFGELGVDVSLHDGIPDRDDVARSVCFAGLGHGEVLADGVKVVGLSQRRTRSLVRVQCLCLLRWNHDELLGLLADPPSGARERLPEPGSLPVSAAELIAALG